MRPTRRLITALTNRRETLLPSSLVAMIALVLVSNLSIQKCRRKSPGNLRSIVLLETTVCDYFRVLQAMGISPP